MIFGCLSGNGKRPPIEGAYSFCAPGLTIPLSPDLQPDRAPGAGPFGFAAGNLTDGQEATGVGWRGTTLGEAGIDVHVRLGERCFVDHIVLKQAGSTQAASNHTPTSAPDPDGIEAVGHRA